MRSRENPYCLTADRLARWLKNFPSARTIGVDRGEIEFLRSRLLKLERLERAAQRDTDKTPSVGRWAAASDMPSCSLECPMPGQSGDGSSIASDAPAWLHEKQN